MEGQKADKPLTARQAWNCENAVGAVCRCRCGGVLHGRRGGGTTPDGEIDLAYFESLPADDPHHLLNSTERAERRAQAAKDRAERKRKEHEEREKKIARAWANLYKDMPKRELGEL